MSRKAECAPCSVGGKAKGWSGESTREFIGRLTVVKYSSVVTLLHCYVFISPLPFFGLSQSSKQSSKLPSKTVFKAVFKTVFKTVVKTAFKNCRQNNLQQQTKNDQEHVNNLIRTLPPHGVYHLPRRRHAAHRQHAAALGGRQPPAALPPRPGAAAGPPRPRRPHQQRLPLAKAQRRRRGRENLRPHPRLRCRHLCPRHQDGPRMVCLDDGQPSV